MKLKSWIKSEHGRSVALARIIGVPQSFVSKMASGEKPVPFDRCIPIERATGGEVTRQELRPDDWHLVWPELSKTQAHQAQAATECVAQVA